MNNTCALAETESRVFGQTSARWFALLGSGPPVDQVKFDCRLVAGREREQKFYVGNEIGAASPIFVERFGFAVVFDGVLYNHQALSKELGDIQQKSGGDADTGGAEVAELILAGYQRWGEGLLARLRGVFSLVIWDSSRELMLALRDPLGCYPLFYAKSPHGFLISTAIDVLLQQPGVSRGVNRASMGGYLMERYPKKEDTFFEAVRRVPPGNLLVVGKSGERTYRYWDPQPESEVNWLKPEEIERFDDVLDQAVERSLSPGPAGIFLSGGLDSVTVAAVATDLHRKRGTAKPLALSLVFPSPDTSEEMIQRGVAATLGLPHVVKTFDDATGAKGLLDPALKMSQSLAAPLINTWLPAYSELALEGGRRGCQSILTGNGGDEWLTVSPFLAADMLREFDLNGVYRLMQSMKRSYNRSTLALLRTTLWRFGLQPLVVPPVHKVVKSVAPGALRMRRKFKRDFPAWIIPDGNLRRRIDEARAEEHARKQEATGGFYLRDMRLNLDHQIVSWEAEELFEVYRRCGVRILQPFWDADLVDLLYRMPPMSLIHDGRNKGLVRASLARRFPQLGFDRQKKIEAGNFYQRLIAREAAPLWRDAKSAKLLDDLGILDERRFRPDLERMLARPSANSGNQIWSVLNLEMWARAHAS